KPPAAAVVRLVLDRVAKSVKPFTICFLGAQGMTLPANARAVPTLKAAAEAAVGRLAAPSPAKPPPLPLRGKHVRGLFAGGTLCTEAQIVFGHAGLAVMSNVPAPGASSITGARNGHVMIDLGADEFTRGRPHPMLEPMVRDAPLAEALGDPEVGIILLDVVLGYGGHADPAGHLAGVLAGRRAGPLIIASVTGTEGDPQPRAAQVRKLTDVGVTVADSSADATTRDPGPDGRLVVVPISRSGALARQFCQSVERANVEAVFERSFYLRCGDDFMCIGEPAIGNGPLTLIADLAPLARLGLQPGRPAW